MVLPYNRPKQALSCLPVLLKIENSCIFKAYSEPPSSTVIKNCADDLL